MTGSLVQTAQNKSQSIKQQLNKVRDMQKYNDQREEEQKRAAKAMEEELKRRLEEQKAR